MALDAPLEARSVDELIADQFPERIGNEIAALAAEQSENVRELRRQADELHGQADELEEQIGNAFAGARLLLGKRANGKLN